MTVEEIEFLKQYEHNFKTAIESNYSRNVVPSALKKMLDIYQRETGKKYSLCTHCPASILGFLKAMGKVYRDQKGNEPILIINDLQNTVTDLENNEVKNIKENAKHTTKQIKKKR